MSNLPADVEQCLDDFVSAAKDAFKTDLVSIVLFGSAAEGRLRATSDVNVLLILRRFEQAAADAMREPMRLAHAAVQMNVMFLLDTELPAAVDAFAVKFSDIIARHRMLHGDDPFLHLASSREALIRRLKQILLNLQLRLRERYVLISLREEQLVQVIADSAPPLRASAASLLQLDGSDQPASPKAALENIVQELNSPELHAALEAMSVARESGELPPGLAAPTLISLIGLCEQLRERAEHLQ